MKLDATLIAAFGRQYEARTAAGEILLCVPRGKKSVFACGDHVKVAVTGPGQGVIEKLEERRSLLYRSDAWRQKLIAANATQVVLVVATEPSFSDEFLSRCLCAAESQQLKVLIVLNKADLAAGLASSRALLAPFAALVRSLSVVLVAEVEPSERNRDLAIAIRLVDEDGTSVGVESKGTMRVGAPSSLPAGAASLVPLVGSFLGVRFAHPGGYVFMIEHEGKELGRITFRVREAA